MQEGKGKEIDLDKLEPYPPDSYFDDSHPASKGLVIQDVTQEQGARKAIVDLKYGLLVTICRAPAEVLFQDDFGWVGSCLMMKLY